MSQTEVPEPKVINGPRRHVLTDIYLHLGAAVLRNLVWYLNAGDGKDFDEIITVPTPGLGTGYVRIAICKPPAPEAATNSQERPLLLVLEGGGFILGQPEDGQKHDRKLADEVRSPLFSHVHRPCIAGCLFCAPGSAIRLTEQLGAIVISIDYAKAPKYPYPHALLQVYAVLRWAFSQDAEKHGIKADPRRVAIHGNSAGGNLTAVLSLLLSFSTGPCARFRQELPPNFKQVAQILLYPSTEQYQSYAARFQRTDAKAKSRSLPVGVCELMEDSYIPPYIDRNQMFVAPLATPTKLLKDLRPPPALVLTAGLDCLKEEAMAYAYKLRETGVGVDIHEYSDAIHGFSHYTSGKDYRKEDVDDCWKRITEALRTSFLP